MTPRGLPGALVVAVLVAGCGGGGESPAATSATTTAPARALTDTDATGAVLTLEDLPDGWSARPPQADRAGGFCTEFDLAQQVAPTGRARAQFEGGSGYLNQVVAVYNAPADARRRMEIVRTGVDRCRRHTGEGLSLELAPASFPKLGDDTVAVKGTAQAAALPASVDLLFIRAGRAVTVLVHLASESLGGPGLDARGLEQVARRAEAKLAALR